MLREIVKQCDEYGIFCSVCGDMASQPIEAMTLIGLGYRHLSMSGASYGRVKAMLRSIRVNELEDYVLTLLKSSARTLRPQLISYAYDHNIEIN